MVLLQGTSEPVRNRLRKHDVRCPPREAQSFLSPRHVLEAGGKFLGRLAATA